MGWMTWTEYCKEKTSALAGAKGEERTDARGSAVVGGELVFLFWFSLGGPPFFF